MAEPQRAAFGRRGIRQRVVLVVLIGSVALVAALVWTFHAISRDARDQLAAERGRLARAVAVHVEGLLDDELETLATVAVDADLKGGAPGGERRLNDAYRRSQLLSTIFFARFDTAQPIVEPPGSAVDPLIVAQAQRLARSGRPMLARASDGRSAILVMPARSPDGTTIGAAGGVMASGQKALVSVLAAAAPPNGAIVLEDATGATVTSGGAVLPADAPILSASAAIGELGWRVSVRQPEADALAPLATIARVGLIVLPAVVLVPVLLAWGAGRSVVRPLNRLTKAAEAIAAGDLDRPVPAGGIDEAGRLARALEDMREALRQRERDRIRGELLKRAIAAQEDERKRVARELHDETSQTVNALLMELEAASARYPSDFTRSRLADALRLTRRLLDGVHRMILDLRPSMLDDLGLWSAIQWFAREHLEPLGIAVRTELSGAERRLPRETEIALFRVAQEALTNIARHARAEHVLIQCAADADRFTIEIEDDGEGFDLASVRPSKDSLRGLGLAGMHERVALVGGRLLLESAPGEGTHVLIDVPIPVAAAAHG